MSADELTPAVVLNWLRTQSKRYGDQAKRCADTAQKFSEAADVLETTFDTSTGKPQSQSAATSQPVSARPVPPRAA